MRILHVHSGNIFGGAERILIAIAGHKSFSPEFEHVFALCFNDRFARELQRTGVEIFFLPEFRLSRPLQLRRARMRLKQLLQESRFDLAIVHSAWSHIAFSRTLKKAGLPLIYWFHTHTEGKTFFERCARLQFPDALVSYSQSVHASTPLLFPGVQSHLVPCPIALDHAAYATANRAQTRKALNTSQYAVVILQTSRLEAWKGHTILLEALGALRSNQNWRCWIAGGAARPQEQAYLAELNNLASKLQINDRVQFLGERSDIPALLMAADIFCQPNLEPEGFGVVFVEALFAGLPIITSAFGGALEIVDEQSGFLLPPGDVAAVTESLRKLIDDQSLRLTLGDNARQSVQERCDRARQFHALEKVFKETVANHA